MNTRHLELRCATMALLQYCCRVALGVGNRCECASVNRASCMMLKQNDHVSSQEAHRWSQRRSRGRDRRPDGRRGHGRRPSRSVPRRPARSARCPCCRWHAATAPPPSAILHSFVTQLNQTSMPESCPPHTAAALLAGTMWPQCETMQQAVLLYRRPDKDMLSGQSTTGGTVNMQT